MNNAPKFAWLDGKIVSWSECTLHARAQGAFWGANVFEGLRGYCTADGRLSVFRVSEHLTRLRQSAKCLHMRIPFSDDEIQAGLTNLLQQNEFDCDVHIVVMAYFGVASNFDAMAQTDSVGMHITAVPMPRSKGYETGISACISSWRRISDDTMPPRIKTGANYHNSRLAQHEARRKGYDSALILNRNGTVSEAPGSCLMMLRNGVLCTPPGTSGVLEGITAAIITELAADCLGLTVRTREIDRTELYICDEAFLAGTLTEILPLVSLDDQTVSDGTPGPLTRRLQALYDDQVRATDSNSDTTVQRERSVR